jgi:hypothetical protein
MGCDGGINSRQEWPTKERSLKGTAKINVPKRTTSRRRRMKGSVSHVFGTSLILFLQGKNDVLTSHPTYSCGKKLVCHFLMVVQSTCLDLGGGGGAEYWCFVVRCDGLGLHCVQKCQTIGMRETDAPVMLFDPCLT